MDRAALKIPEIGEYVRGTGTLVAIEQPEVVVPPLEFIFRRVSAHCEVRLNGVKLNEIEGFWDFYGLETSVQSAIAAANEYAHKNKIDEKSELEVVAVRLTYCTRMHKKLGENFYAKEYFDFSQMDHGSSWNVPEKTWDLVWSSKTPKVGV